MDRRQFLVAAGALVLAPRAAAQTLGRRPVALVTADLESRLVAADLRTGRVLRHVPTLAYPRSIEAIGNRAVVAHSELGAVSIVHGATLGIAHVLHGFEEPRYTAAHADGRHAWVTDAKRGEVVAVDVLRGAVLGREEVGPLARHVSLSPDGRTLWIALGSKAEQVAVVDVSTRAHPRLERRFRPPFLAHDVAFAPDGRHVWLSSGDRDELAVYSPAGKLLRRVAGDWPPQHVTFAGGRAYVASGWSGTLNVHRAGGRHVRRTVVPVGSYNVQHAAGAVLTPGLGTGTLTVLDDEGAVRFERHLARSSHDACVVIR